MNQNATNKFNQPLHTETTKGRKLAGFVSGSGGEAGLFQKENVAPRTGAWIETARRPVGIQNRTDGRFVEISPCGRTGPGVTFTDPKKALDKIGGLGIMLTMFSGDLDPKFYPTSSASSFTPRVQLPQDLFSDPDLTTTFLSPAPCLLHRQAGVFVSMGDWEVPSIAVCQWNRKVALDNSWVSACYFQQEVK